MAEGLEGVMAGETAICAVEAIGDGLRYRGYDIRELVKKSSFEEVAYLLIHGKLPNAKELSEYNDKLIELRELTPSMRSLLQIIPADSHPMDVLRTATSYCGNLIPETKNFKDVDVADLLLAKLPGILLYWYHFHHSNQKINPETPTKTLSEHFLYLLKQQNPDPLQAQMIDESMILYAEHEFNASTFAARVTTATLSDFYSAICSAIGTLKGSLHGGANEAAFELINSYNTPTEAITGIQQKLAQSQKIMGFGHRVYKVQDPRSDIIKNWARHLSDKTHNHRMFAIAEAIDDTMKQEKKIFPNVDFYSAVAYGLCDIPMYLFTPLFVLSRLSGWSAHILEQREHNRLIRPAAKYIGPSPRPVPSLAER